MTTRDEARERLARIIDPDEWLVATRLRDLPPNPHDPDFDMNALIEDKCKRSLAKADAILALLSPDAGPDQPRPSVSEDQGASRDHALTDGVALDWRSPPPHWPSLHDYGRHPASAEEWNPQLDPPGRGESIERTIRRLNFAGDLADPRAPDQMALVCRIDLIRLKHDWITKTARLESSAMQTPDAVPGTNPKTTDKGGE